MVYQDLDAKYKTFSALISKLNAGNMRGTIQSVLKHFGRAEYFVDGRLISSLLFQADTLLRRPLMVRRKPAILQIEVTNRCNLGCRMCMRTTRDLEERDMSFPFFKELAERNLNYHHSSLLYGQGEPFLNPDIFEIIAFERKKKNFVTTVTNGSLLTKEICAEIIASGLNVLRLSFDASSENTYDRIRRNGDFPVLIENVRNLAELIRREKKGPKLCIVYMVMEDNFEDLPSLAPLAKKLGVNAIEAKEVPAYMIGGELALSLKLKTEPGMATAYARVLKETESIARKNHIRVLLPELNSERRKSQCLNPWFKSYITAAGYVTPCSRYFSSNQYRCGNLMNDNLDTIWNNEAYVTFRQAHKSDSLRDRNIDECIRY